MSVGASVNDWLTGIVNNTLYAPEGYEHHGKRGRQPYQHVIAGEVKRMSFSKVEDRKSSDDKLYYSVIIIDISDIKSYYTVTFPSFRKNYLIRQDEYEECYDWIISNAVSKIFSEQGAEVKNHIRHDIYKCAYDEIGNLLETNIRETLTKQNYGFVLGTKVKTMVCGSNLIVARSSNG